MFRLSVFILAPVSAAVMMLTSNAQAVPLNNAFVAQPFLDTALGGTTVAARPELAGLIIADINQSFSYGGLNIFGTVQSRVVRETTSGTLDFYWRITVDPASTGGGIDAFRLGNFGYSNLTDADWRIDGLGTEAPTVGRLFNPATHPDGDINFLFDPASEPGESRFFFLHTDAQSYAETAAYDLLAGPDQTLSGVFDTFAPSIPEPATLALLGLAFAGLGFARRRNLH